MCECLTANASKTMTNKYNILCEIRDLSCGDHAAQQAKRAELRRQPEKIRAMMMVCGVNTWRALIAASARYAENAAYDIR